MDEYNCLQIFQFCGLKSGLDVKECLKGFFFDVKIGAVVALLYNASGSITTMINKVVPSLGQNLGVAMRNKG